jgi:hypothetical protein
MVHGFLVAVILGRHPNPAPAAAIVSDELLPLASVQLLAFDAICRPNMAELNH